MVLFDYIERVGALLNDVDNPMKLRFRALFTLKNIGGNRAIDQIVKCFSDKSALLKHELAYCLGQMKDPYAVPALQKLLQDESQEIVVRHEAGEALGAIAQLDCLDLLEKYRTHPIREIAETCELAVGRLKYLSNGGKEPRNIYGSIDPTPPSDEKDIETLKATLYDTSLSIYARYAAMFSLRDINTNESINIINEAFRDNSVLFKHEVAFVLGQLQSPLSVPALIKVVRNEEENEIVRHECIEALGAIGTLNCTEIIKEYLNDEKDIVRESCEVALDMSDYENSTEFQYANGLEMVSH